MSVIAELPRVSGRHRNRALAKARAVRAVELITEGLTYEQAASELGYADRGTVHRIVHKELDARKAEGVDMLRSVEIARLDALQVGLWDKALAGDPAASTAVVRIIEQRARLCGLIGTPARHYQQRGGDMTGKTVVLLPHELAALDAQRKEAPSLREVTPRTS